MLVLRTLLAGSANGYEVAKAIERASDDVLQVDHGSLYPALRRLEKKGWLTAEWKVSATNRRARYYSLTPAGKKQVDVEHSSWERLANAVARVMQTA